MGALELVRLLPLVLGQRLDQLQAAGLRRRFQW